MSGAALQIAAQSPIGEIFSSSSNPDFFFQGIPENIGNFGMTEISIAEQIPVKLGNKTEITIPTAGHLLTSLQLQLYVPAQANSTGFWPAYLAFALIDSIELLAEGSARERLTGQYLSINYQLRTPAHKKQSGLDALVGRNRLPMNQAHILSIPIPFAFFQNHYGQSLPIGLLSRASIAIRVTLRHIGELSTYVYSNDIELALYGNYITLASELFRKMQEKDSVNYLIKRVVHTSHGVPLKELPGPVPSRFGILESTQDTSLAIDLPFINPVVDMAWVATSPDLLSPATFAVNPSPPEDYPGQVTVPGGSSAPLQASQILFAETPRTAIRNKQYFEVEQPNQYAPAVPDIAGINYFSFSLAPDDASVISGYADMGSIENTRLVTYPAVGQGEIIALNAASQITASVDVYARVYDIARVRAGRLEYYIKAS